MQILSLQPQIAKDFSITRTFFLTVGQNNFGNKIPFITCFRLHLRSNTLEQFQIKLEKIIGIQKPAGKVRQILKIFVLLICINPVLGRTAKKGNESSFSGTRSSAVGRSNSGLTTKYISGGNPGLTRF